MNNQNELIQTVHMQILHVEIPQFVHIIQTMQLNIMINNLCNEIQSTIIIIRSNNKEYLG